MGTAEVRGWGVPPCGERFFTNQRTFVGADILSARQRNFTNLLYPSAKRDPFSVLLVAACPARGLFFRLPSWGHSPAVGGRAALRMGRTPLRVKPLFLLQESGVFLPCSWFLPAWLGPKPLFLFREKKTAVLDSEKEKVDQWEYWGGALQPGVGFVLLCCSSGERLWGVLPVSGGLRLSDSWSPLRHCR